MAEKEGELSLLMNAFYSSSPKKKITQDVVDYLKEKYFSPVKKCPECSNEMIEVSMSFKTPAKKEIKKWEIMESHYKARGFVSNGLPNKMKDYIQLLENSYQWHVHMLQHPQNHHGYKESIADARDRLRANLLSLENELRNIKSKDG